MSKSEFLKQIPIFSNFESEEIEMLSDICREISLDVDSIIFSEGDPGDALFIIKSGEIKIYRQVGEKKKTLATLGPNDFFGEMALLDGEPRSASTEATKPTELLILRKEEFTKLIESEYVQAKLLMPIVKILCQRLRKVNEKFRDMVIWG